MTETHMAAPTIKTADVAAACKAIAVRASVHTPANGSAPPSGVRFSLSSLANSDEDFIASTQSMQDSSSSLLPSASVRGGFGVSASIAAISISSGIGKDEIGGAGLRENEAWSDIVSTKAPDAIGSDDVKGAGRPPSRRGSVYQGA